MFVRTHFAQRSLVLDWAGAEHIGQQIRAGAVVLTRVIVTFVDL